MPFSSWMCTNNSKTMLLRIVHPGGHVELHDRPVTAAEIMCRNPRCLVAYPCVFQQPWAIVAPDTVLMLGQKFYVVPLGTIRKLQRLSPKHSPSPAREITISSSVGEIRNIKSSKEEGDDVMTKANVRDMTKETRTLSSSTDLSDSNTPTRNRTQDMTGYGLRSSSKKMWSPEHWQPSLESITEE